MLGYELKLELHESFVCATAHYIRGGSHHLANYRVVVVDAEGFMGCAEGIVGSRLPFSSQSLESTHYWPVLQPYQQRSEDCCL